MTDCGSKEQLGSVQNEPRHFAPPFCKNIKLACFIFTSNSPCHDLHSANVDVHALLCVHVLVSVGGRLHLHLERVAASAATQLRFTVRLLQTVARGPWPHVWTWKWRMQREERRHVAVEVWMAAGGRGHWIKSPIRVTGG